ncbi:MAG: hypothetical protein ABF285_00980 [Pacificibacter sp.]|uniref:hypothetical protein n=1 Tax=Pacificibacter sp. TaxID=1917866 RepID=UPI00321B30DC
MKKVILAATIVAASASASFAGGYSEPMVEAAPIVVPTEAGSSGSLGGNAALILLGLVAVAVALSTDGSGSSE